MVQGLGGAPDEPHAVNVAATCISEGSGVGKVKEPPGTIQNEIPPLIPLTDSELSKIRGDAVTIVFKMQVTQHMEVQWETIFWGSTLYIQVPNAILPEGPKEGFVSLLEYAEEKLQCTHVVVCFKKDRFDRACLIRTFMYLGFVILAPGHELAPSTSDYLYMAYIIE